MNSKFKLLDIVALLKDIPEHKLVVGQVGTVAEVLDTGTFLVEFCNQKGETLALASVKSGDLLLLRYDLKAA